MNATFVQLVATLALMLGACTAGGVTMRLNRPDFDRSASTAAATAVSPSTATAAITADPTVSGASIPTASATPDTSTDGAGRSDGGTAYTDPQGRFELWFGDAWSVVDTPESETSDEVEWVLRLHRGTPDAAPPDGSLVPPNGAAFDLGIAAVSPGASLGDWAAIHLPIDTNSWSITADAMRGTIGAEGYDSVFREGQILPYNGRWREWLVPDPRRPSRVYIVRVAAYGDDDQWEMAHGKVVARTLRFR